MALSSNNKRDSQLQNPKKTKKARINSISTINKKNASRKNSQKNQEYFNAVSESTELLLDNKNQIKSHRVVT